MGQHQQGSHNPAMSVFAFVSNVGTAVTIVFINKVLMDSKHGYAFTFACTLSAIHFLTTSACVLGMQRTMMSSADRNYKLPWRDTLYFSFVCIVSIASLNLSLFVNPVGLYQVAKLLVIPFVCGVEAVWLGRRFNMATLTAIATVIVGVAVVTVNDLGSGQTKLVGVLLAALSVAGSGMQQILCGVLQRKHNLQSHQLLAATAPPQGAMLLLLGPWVDWAVSGRWVLGYTMSSPALGVLAASCAMSVGVNMSQFMCLGRFSAVTFQVLGHTKTILVLLISWLALGEDMPLRKAAGMAIAVAGMIAYGYYINAATGASSNIKGTAKVSSGGNSSSSKGSSRTADALERGQGAAGGLAGSADGDDDEGLPLLRNVSGDKPAWAGENVMVVAVDRGGASGKH